MIEGTSDLLLLVDGEGLVVEYNQTACNTLAENDTELPKTSVFDLFFVPDSDDGDKVPPVSLLSRQDLEVSNGESTRHWGVLKTGEAIELDISGLPTNEDILTVVSARLMNRHDRRERELLVARRQLHEMRRTLHEDRQREQAARMSSLSTLAGALSHDLNNVLVVVCCNVELLREVITDEDSVMMLDDIRMGAESAKELATRFITFSKGPAPLLSPLVIEPWIRRVSHAFRASHNVTVNIDCEEEGPQVSADEPQLTQVLLNLLINAEQSTETKQPINIVVAPCVSGDLRFWSIKVIDHGTGIDTASLPHLFEPFFTTKPGGTGLGLASAQRIIEEHKGELSCRNRDEGGAEFEIRLRDLEFEETTITQFSTEQILADTGDVVEALGHIRVVLMDDEPSVLQTVARMLEALGAEVHPVACGEDLLALKRDRASEWDKDDLTLVYVLDILVNEGLGGVETLRLLMLEDGNVRAVACSGHSSIKVNDAFRALGFLGFLRKPFRVDELVSTLCLVCDETNAAQNSP
jgi:signal transduction histidine kinase/CheY-like chemotaxis protein